tara:strand:+ start:71 stop:1768 length:1698 start_codon:yes stop_codon:yes gene_type:complete
MNIFALSSKIIGHILFVIIFIFFSTLQAKEYKKFDKADFVADYFSGILLLNQSKYDDSYKYLKKLDGLEESHPTFSSKYLNSLVNSGNFSQAVSFSKKVDKVNKGSFESNLIIGINYLKKSKYELSSKYFLKAKKSSRTLLDSYIADSLNNWSNMRNYNLDGALIKLNQLDDRFENFKKIQTVFLNCFFKGKDTKIVFEKLISNKQTDFSRYHYFYANFLESSGERDKAKKIISDALMKYPRNLLLNQYKIDLESLANNINFDCKNETDVVAEIIYIAANAFSSQSIFPISNFYLNLSKYLNNDFYAFDTLLAENFYKIGDYSYSKKIYKGLINKGKAFEWYSNKQISKILLKEKKKDKSLILLKEAYDALPFKGVYETFDYAEFLKNNEEFKNSIKYYSEILKKIDDKHPLFPEVTDSRGVSYERIGEWDNAEKDLLSSLEASPDQAYVINYLAYSWIEKGVNIEKSLKMLEKANELKSNDPYIIDSLGWALFKLKRFEESKEYLQIALRLMPADPIVNDHYGDVLWKNGKKLQARYYWNNVLQLENTEKDLKDKVEEKLVKGL